jgi:hypothetical protein
MDVPVGFTLAMSCVLANRVLLNVKEAGRAVRKLTTSRRSMNTRRNTNLGDMSFCSPGTLSLFEMGQPKRSMRVNYLEDIFETSDEEYDIQKVPWVVQ